MRYLSSLYNLDLHLFILLIISYNEKAHVKVGVQLRLKDLNGSCTVFYVCLPRSPNPHVFFSMFPHQLKRLSRSTLEDIRPGFFDE